LRALSGVFAMIVRWRAQAYRHGLLPSHRISRPVIVVGNLSVGGTGKTPLVIWLVERLRECGLHPGIVLRGYGAHSAAQGPLAVESDSDPAQVGDEALLLRQRAGVPVRVDRDRVRAARSLVEAGVNVIVADDGLQHLRLARDYEIVVIDAARGFGNGYLLPAGPLREPRSRLATVGAVVINGEGSAGPGLALGLGLAQGGSSALFSMQLRGERLYPLAGTDASIALSSLAGKHVHAIAGIGNPQRFFDQLRVAGLTVITHPFPDHHRYRGHELQFSDELPVLMTEKDAVKCRAFAAENHWYLPIAADFVPEQGAALLARLQGSLAR
jgi:tetraacyldisaccharide 4'-kinase